MSLFHYFVISTISVVFISSVIIAFYYKSRLNIMSGMMISMAVGSNIGLSAGILFGSLYQGNLFYATSISVLTGILAGTTFGSILGVLPTLEGFLAGLMSGMMGAMLGGMITRAQSDMMINLFLTLTICTLFLFQILKIPTEKESKIHNKKWLYKPLFTFLFLTIYLILGSKLDKQVTFSKSNSTKQEGHSTHFDPLLHRENPQMDHSWP